MGPGGGAAADPHNLEALLRGLRDLDLGFPRALRHVAIDCPEGVVVPPSSSPGWWTEFLGRLSALGTVESLRAPAQAVLEPLVVGGGDGVSPAAAARLPRVRASLWLTGPLAAVQQQPHPHGIPPPPDGNALWDALREAYRGRTLRWEVHLHTAEATGTHPWLPTRPAAASGDNDGPRLELDLYRPVGDDGGARAATVLLHQVGMLGAAVLRFPDAAASTFPTRGLESVAPADVAALVAHTRLGRGRRRPLCVVVGWSAAWAALTPPDAVAYLVLNGGLLVGEAPWCVVLQGGAVAAVGSRTRGEWVGALAGTFRTGCPSDALRYDGPGRAAIEERRQGMAATDVEATARWLVDSGRVRVVPSEGEADRVVEEWLSTNDQR